MSNGGRLAVVIGSGGAKCVASLGLWEVLQAEGIQVGRVVGSSGGSIYAAMLALGADPQELQSKTQSLWTSDLMGGYASNLRAAMSGETRFTETSGLIDDGPVLERFHSVFGEASFGDTRLPLHIVSTDLYTGEMFVHSSGRILDAVRASIAIPLVFPPWQVDGRWLVDGAVSNPLPIDVAIKEGADLIVAMGFELTTRSRMRSYPAVVTHLNSIYMNNILKLSFAFYNLAHHAEVIPILPDLGAEVGMFGGEQAAQGIAAGAEATREQIPYIRRVLAAGS